MGEVKGQDVKSGGSTTNCPTNAETGNYSFILYLQKIMITRTCKGCLN